MSDRLDDIRRRHKRDDCLRDGLCPGAHADRAFLLDLAERQRAEIERLREMLLDIAVELRGEEPRIVFQIRKALEGKP